MTNAYDVKRVWKLKKRLEAAGRKLASALPSVSLAELRRVFDANTLEAILDGELRVPESTIARSIKDSLRGRLREVEVTIDERRVEIVGRYKKLGVELDARIIGRDQAFTPTPPPGVITMNVEYAGIDAGGVVLKRVLSLVILAVLRFIYGEKILEDQLGVVEGVTLEGDVLTLRLADIPQVREVIERSVFGVRFGDLIQVTDIRFARGFVEVHLSAAEVLRRAALMLDPMQRPGRPSGPRRYPSE
jgi:hypothetical protein